MSEYNYRHKLGTHRLHSPSDFQQTAIQPLGASPIILGLPSEEANFCLRLPSPRAARCLQTDCLQSDARMELESTSGSFHK